MVIEVKREPVTESFPDMLAEQHFLGLVVIAVPAAKGGRQHRRKSPNPTA
jgi:hypothetical protein